MADHEHVWGEAVWTDAVPVDGLPRNQGFYVYASACACGAVEVSTAGRRLAVLEPGEVREAAEPI